jgi:beta-xylosidase
MNAEAVSLLKRQAARRPNFFDERGLDQLFSLVMELATEVWVQRERIYAIEAVSADNLAAKVAKWQPTPQQSEELAGMRHAMLQSLFRTIDTGTEPVSCEGETADPIPPGSASR